MLNTAAHISLFCVLVHVVFTWEGLPMAWSTPILEELMPAWMRKPLYECLICMSSFWTVAFVVVTLQPISVDVLLLFITVGGLNTIACAILNLTDYGC